MTTIPTPADLPVTRQRSETDSAVNAALKIGRLNAVREDSRFAATLVPKDCDLKIIDREELEQKLAAHPHRKTGTVHVHSADAFVSYLDKHALDCTEVWTDQAKKKLVAVINAHDAAVEDDDANTIGEGLAGHGDHRCSLELLRTPNWTAWLSHDKKWLDQATFAEHLDDNAIDIAAPDPATMLEIAEHFQATVGADFKQAERLADGQVQLRYEETVSARAGESGDLEIPREFTLHVIPFVGGHPIDVTVRFRYRIRAGQLSLSYAIRNPHDIEEAAFNTIVDHVSVNVDEPVYHGRPE